MCCNNEWFVLLTCVGMVGAFGRADEMDAAGTAGAVPEGWPKGGRKWD